MAEEAPGVKYIENLTFFSIKNYRDFPGFFKLFVFILFLHDFVSTSSVYKTHDVFFFSS